MRRFRFCIHPACSADRQANCVHTQPCISVRWTSCSRCHTIAKVPQAILKVTGGSVGESHGQWRNATDWIGIESRHDGFVNGDKPCMRDRVRVVHPTCLQGNSVEAGCGVRVRRADFIARIAVPETPHTAGKVTGGSVDEGHC